MRPDLVALAPPVLYAALLVVAAGYDVLQRRIPNWVVVGLLLVFVLAAALGVAPSSWTSSLAAFAITLAGTVVLYLLGWIGAGDSKLISAAALFAGLSNLMLLVLGTAIAGGVYAVAVLCVRPREVMRSMTEQGRGDGKRRGIPYGVAITAGALATGYATGFLTPRLLSTHSPPQAAAALDPAGQAGSQLSSPVRLPARV